jgi:hypothetical protein
MKGISVSEKYPYGQKMFLKSNLPGKPKVAYVVCKDVESEVLIKMSECFPYMPGRDPHFFVHITKLEKLWRHAKEGLQGILFK